MLHSPVERLSESKQICKYFRSDTPYMYLLGDFQFSTLTGESFFPEDVSRVHYSSFTFYSYVFRQKKNRLHCCCTKYSMSNNIRAKLLIPFINTFLQYCLLTSSTGLRPSWKSGLFSYYCTLYDLPVLLRSFTLLV